MVDEALSRLEAEQPQLARVLEWHVFGGLTFGEIARVLRLSERTVLRHWRAARALVHARLASTNPPRSGYLSKGRP
jgi:DNA-binding CsgD family transcriptional regulator